MYLNKYKKLLLTNKKNILIISVSLLVVTIILSQISKPKETEIYFSSEKINVEQKHSCKKPIQIIPTPTTKIIPPLCPIYTVDEDHIVEVGKYIKKISFEHHDHNSYQKASIAYQTLDGEWKTENNLQNFDVNSGANSDYTCRAENPKMYTGTHNEYDGDCYVQKSLDLDECTYVQNIKLNITNGQKEGAHSHFCFNFEECPPTKPKVAIEGNVSCKNPDGSIDPIPNENVRMRFIHSGSTYHDFIAGVTDINGNYSRPPQELDSLLAIDRFSTDYTGGELLSITCNGENCMSLPAGYDMLGKENLKVDFIYNCPKITKESVNLKGQVYCQDPGGIKYPVSNTALSLYNDITKKTIYIGTDAEGFYSFSSEASVSAKVQDAVAIRMNPLSNGFLHDTYPYSNMNWPPKAINCGNEILTNCAFNYLDNPHCGDANASYEHCVLQNPTHSNFDFAFTGCEENTDTISCLNISFPEEVNVGETVNITCQGSGDSSANAKFKLFSHENEQIGGYSTGLDLDKKAVWPYRISLDTEPGTYYAECEICDQNNENCVIGSIN